MAIQTLGTGLLYQVHRDKDRLIYEAERRKAFWLALAIFACVGATITIGVIYL